MHRPPFVLLALGSLLIPACADKRTMPITAPGAPPDAAADLSSASDVWVTSDAQLSSDGETGWVVVPADAAITADRPRSTECGNGILQRGEDCDDGNTLSNDGCSALCQLESERPCPEYEGPCVQLSVCGNGVRTTTETCDDGNTAAGDGCAADCQSVEPGWKCPAPGRRCIPICGDRELEGSETCDDGNRLDGDGCSIHCLTEPGWDCSGVGGPCVRSALDGGIDGGVSALRCGDGILSGAEECDDGGARSDETYGGCTATCFFGPYCGDGITNGPEECDLGANNGWVVGQGGCTVGCVKTHFCGDGIVDVMLGEECDLGDRNGRGLDYQLNPTDDPWGVVYCTYDCSIPLPFYY